MAIYTGKQYEKNYKRLENLSADQIKEMHEITKKAIARFKGNASELETALGMFYFGHHVGWKVLVMMHSKKTIRKYEDILQINIREYFEPEGPSWERSLGYKWAKKIGEFWKIVSGDIKDEKINKKEIGS
jgi:hypothetical protein